MQAESARIDAELRSLAVQEGAPVTWFSVGPLTTSSWQPTTPKGTLGDRRYRASATIRATFADFSALAERVAAWGASEVTNVQQVRWTLTDASRLRVEASALGNIGWQLKGLGLLQDLADVRRLIRHNTRIDTLHPHEVPQLDHYRTRFAALCAHTHSDTLIEEVV